MNSKKSTLRSRPEVTPRILRGVTSGRQRDLPGRQAGFTLIELLVVIGIITFIAAAIFANTHSFGGGQIEVENLAYDMALSIREAQQYGISVAHTTTGFSDGYGMNFTTSANNQYILFVDTTPNGSYDAGESVTTSKINNGLYIASLQVCNGTCTSVNSLNILFIRPEPNAYFNPTNCSLNADGNESSCRSSYASSSIVVASQSGCKSTISVYQSGAISVTPTVTSCSK